MEITQLPQSNVASLPPPEAAVVGSPVQEQRISSLPGLPAASVSLRHENDAGRLGQAKSGISKAGTLASVIAVGPFLAGALLVRWKSYRERLRECQVEFSEEAVHELRVATRRLIAQLVLLSCVSRNPSLEKTRRILKRRLAALGGLRDAQVQRSFVGREITRFPELALLRKYLERQERRLAKTAAAKVGRWKTRKIEKWVEALGEELADGHGGARAQNRLTDAVLGATVGAFADAVERRQTIDLADLSTVHRMRVAFKRFRYMVESLSPDVTGLSKRQLRALAYYQRKMGILQDLEVLQHCVAGYLREQPMAESLMGPFGRYLQRRRSRALKSFLKSADRLFAFWPPARLVTADELVPARNAA
jgi:CHAD domain-containing protein